MYPLIAPDIAEHLRIIQKANRATDWHFRVGSRFFDALREHVRTAPNTKCIVDRENRKVSCHRGTGYAVELRDPILHFALPGEVENLSFTLRVGYEPLEDDPEYDHDHTRDVGREYRLYCPIDLELNFTREKFNLWTKHTKEELDKERLKQERKELDRLLKRHPKYVTEKLLKLKPNAS